MSQSAQHPARKAKQGLFEINDRAAKLAAEARAAGMHPYEVWLGPEEAETVRLGMATAPGIYGSVGDGVEGKWLAGLRIRVAEDPGLRIGALFG